MLKDSKERILAKRLVTFTNAWTQGWGLMFRKPAKNTAYLFDFGKPMRSPFHMWFVFWPIDLFLLDKQGNIVDEKRNFRPFMIYHPKKEFWYAVECVPGLIKSGIGNRII